MHASDVIDSVHILISCVDVYADGGDATACSPAAGADTSLRKRIDTCPIPMTGPYLLHIIYTSF